MSKLPDPVESALAYIEQRFSAVSARLIAGEPEALAEAADALRQVAIEFSQIAPSLALSGAALAALKTRVHRLAAGVAIQRENLIRRQMVVQRALDALVPGAQQPAYARPAGAYGSIGKQTGAFKVLAA